MILMATTNENNTKDIYTHKRNIILIVKTITKPQGDQEKTNNRRYTMSSHGYYTIYY